MLDCTTLEPLADDKQEAPYNQPNVRLPRNWPSLLAAKTMWKAQLKAPLVAQSNAASCDKIAALNATDCLNALAVAYNRGGDLVPLGNAIKDASVEIAVSHRAPHCSSFFRPPKNMPPRMKLWLADILHEVQSYQSCAIQLHYDEDWNNMNCGVPLLEVVAAAQTTFDSCLDGDANMISGSHVVRNKGNCGSTVYYKTHLQVS